MTVGAVMLLTKAVSIAETCKRVPQVVKSAHVERDTAINPEHDLLVVFVRQVSV